MEHTGSGCNSLNASKWTWKIVHCSKYCTFCLQWMKHKMRLEGTHSKPNDSGLNTHFFSLKYCIYLRPQQKHPRLKDIRPYESVVSRSSDEQRLPTAGLLLAPRNGVLPSYVPCPLTRCFYANGSMADVPNGKHVTCTVECDETKRDYTPILLSTNTLRCP